MFSQHVLVSHSHASSYTMAHRCFELNVNISLIACIVFTMLRQISPIITCDEAVKCFTLLIQFCSNPFVRIKWKLWPAGVSQRKVTGSWKSLQLSVDQKWWMEQPSWSAMPTLEPCSYYSQQHNLGGIQTKCCCKCSLVVYESNF